MFQYFQISKTYHDSTIVKFFETLGEANCFGPTTYKKHKLRMSSTCLMSGSVKQIEDLGFP